MLLLSSAAIVRADLAPDVLPSTVIEFEGYQSQGAGHTFVETAFANGTYTDIIRQGGRTVWVWYTGGEGTYAYEKTGASTARLTLTGTHPAEPSGVWNLTYTEADRGQVVSGVGSQGGYYSGTFTQFDRNPVPLTNLSNRTQIDNHSISIAGFVVAGTVPRQVLIRVRGPSLAQYGVPTPLPNPRLAVYDADGAKLAENLYWEQGFGGYYESAWVEAVRRVSALVAAPPLAAGSPEPAVLLTLAPGAYTIHAQSEVEGEQGEILTEVYFFR